MCEKRRTTLPLVTGAGRTSDYVAQTLGIKDYMLTLVLNLLSNLRLSASLIFPRSHKPQLLRHVLSDCREICCLQMLILQTCGRSLQQLRTTRTRGYREDCARWLCLP